MELEPTTQPKLQPETIELDENMLSSVDSFISQDALDLVDKMLDRSDGEKKVEGMTFTSDDFARVVNVSAALAEKSRRLTHVEEEQKNVTKTVAILKAAVQQQSFVLTAYAKAMHQNERDFTIPDLIYGASQRRKQRRAELLAQAEAERKRAEEAE